MQARTRKITWPWVLVIIWLVLGFLLQMSAFLPNHPGKTEAEIRYAQGISLGYLGCGLSTLLVFPNRRRWRPFPNATPKKRFLWLGWLGAAWAETLFWIAEKITGAVHVAASPNLIVVLLLTMPWYIAMIWVLQKAQAKCGFSWPVVLMLGGIYEVGCDGTVGYLIGGGAYNLAYIALLALMYPAFMVVYSIMVLPATWFGALPPIEPPIKGAKRFGWALAPLLPLIPYAFILWFLFIFLLHVK